VQAHGGSLWAENNSDRGATFCFTLPVKAPADPLRKDPLASAPILS
jgi:signal transduction histidine kinase